MIRTITDLARKNINTLNLIYSFDYNGNRCITHKLQFKASCGIINRIYVILNNKGELINIILPIWTQAQTITWHNDYYRIVRNELKGYKFLSDIDIQVMSTCILYGIDDINLKIQHLGTITLNNFIKYGATGKNYKSVFLTSKEIPKNIKIIIDK